MQKFFKYPVVVCAVALFLVGTPVVEAQRGGRGDRLPKGLEDLTEEQQQRLRELFAEVNQREDIEQARIEAYESFDAYKRMMRKAIGEIDPEMAKLLDEAHAESGPSMRHKFHGPHPSIGKHLFRHRIPAEKRELFEKIRREVEKSSNFHQRMKQLRESDEPEKRAVLVKEYARSLRKAIADKAPELAQYLKPEESETSGE